MSIKTSSQLQSEIPQYKNIENISIDLTALKNIVKFCTNSVNQNVEGVLFGREDEDRLLIESAIPIGINDDNIRNIVRQMFKFILVG